MIKHRQEKRAFMLLRVKFDDSGLCRGGKTVPLKNYKILFLTFLRYKLLYFHILEFSTHHAIYFYKLQLLYKIERLIFVILL